MNGILLNNADTVITVIEDIPAGGPVSFVFSGRQKQIFATEPIPQYHKMAIADIKAKADVLKYGERIGYATRDIFIGQHVHTHNVNNK